MKVLFVCTAGQHRSKTAAEIYKRLYPNSETMFLGTNAFDDIDKQESNKQLLEWADRIYVMENRHKDKIIEFTKGYLRIYAKIKVVGIPDLYNYNHPELIRLLNESLR